MSKIMIKIETKIAGPTLPIRDASTQLGGHNCWALFPIGPRVLLHCLYIGTSSLLLNE
jgi:hypothetical protein